METRQVDGPNLGSRYSLGPAVQRRIASAHVRKSPEPTTRRLRIFAIDPAAAIAEGSRATATIPYEPLEPGPIGKLFEVDCRDYVSDTPYPPTDLDDYSIVHAMGHAPSESNYRFHAQMVYAVASMVHATFRRALGREIGWRAGTPDEPARLRLIPFGSDARNAWYEPERGEIRFGYASAGENPSDRTLPLSRIYAGLSHDIIAHELAHALLDGLRPNLSQPTSNDASGFHEGFADIVALFHHFFQPEALEHALAKARGDPRKARFLFEIGQQMGRSQGIDAPVRSARSKQTYDPNGEAHAVGNVLVAAVFDAYCTLFKRKTSQLLLLATNGTGRLPPGELSSILLAALTKKARQLAEQVLSIVIRAIDYLPPVDVRLGEYLRAIITADSDLVADDPWRYREALVDAFRKRRIYPRDVVSLNEDSLLWCPPRMALPPIEELCFREIWFEGDPGQPVSVAEHTAQATAFGEFVTEPSRLHEFGLVERSDPRLDGDTVALPRVEYVRTLRRPGPDGRIVFDTVAEVVQTRNVRSRGGDPGFPLDGGSTVILNAEGEVRYVVVKGVAASDRVERRRRFLRSDEAGRYWQMQHGEWRQRASLFRALHDLAGST
jgi:hypothetical protein